jgi:hypothetical protein
MSGHLADPFERQVRQRRSIEKTPQHHRPRFLRQKLQNAAAIHLRRRQNERFVRSGSLLGECGYFGESLGKFRR